MIGVCAAAPLTIVESLDFLEESEVELEGSEIGSGLLARFAVETIEWEDECKRSDFSLVGEVDFELVF